MALPRSPWAVAPARAPRALAKGEAGEAGEAGDGVVGVGVGVGVAAAAVVGTLVGMEAIVALWSFVNCAFFDHSCWSNTSLDGL
jgi:hypothetical protein